MIVSTKGGSSEAALKTPAEEVKNMPMPRLSAPALLRNIAPTKRGGGARFSRVSVLDDDRASDDADDDDDDVSAAAAAPAETTTTIIDIADEDDKDGGGGEEAAAVS